MQDIWVPNKIVVICSNILNITKTIIGMHYRTHMLCRFHQFCVGIKRMIELSTNASLSLSVNISAYVAMFLEKRMRANSQRCSFSNKC